MYLSASRLFTFLAQRPMPASPEARAYYGMDPDAEPAKPYYTASPLQYHYQLSGALALDAVELMFLDYYVRRNVPGTGAARMRAVHCVHARHLRHHPIHLNHFV